MRIWTLTGGRRGNEVITQGIAQTIAQAQATANAGATQISAMQVHLPRPWAWMPRAWATSHYAAFDKSITLPAPDMRANMMPDIVLASGAATIAHARYLRRVANNNSCFTVYLQNPRIAPRHFDFIWAPMHDTIEGDNVFKTLLSPHTLDAAHIAAQAQEWRGRLLPDSIMTTPPVAKNRAKKRAKIIGVMIGGPSRAYAFSRTDIERLAQQLAALAREGHTILVAPSPRTPARYGDILRAALPPHDTGASYVWGGAGANPYAAILGLAEQLIVTADSVNMVGEACAVGKPVQIFALDGGTARFNRFHTALRQADYVRPFAGVLENWQTRPQNYTQIIADKIMQAYFEKRQAVESAL